MILTLRARGALIPFLDMLVLNNGGLRRFACYLKKTWSQCLTVESKIIGEGPFSYRNYYEDGGMKCLARQFMGTFIRDGPRWIFAGWYSLIIIFHLSNKHNIIHTFVPRKLDWLLGWKQIIVWKSSFCHANRRFLKLIIFSYAFITS